MTPSSFPRSGVSNKLSALQGALSILDFELLDSEQGRRIALAVESAAIELRAQLIAGPQDDPRDAEFAYILGDLARSLHGLYD